MKIEIGQESFFDVISRAQSTLERKSTRPILENVLLKAFGGELTISATDLRVSLTQKVPCKVMEAGSISIHGRKLHEIIKEISKEDVVLETKENNWVSILAGNSAFHIPGTPAEEYPSFPTPPEKFQKINPTSFDRVLMKTAFAASSDETRIYLCGVYFKEWTDSKGKNFLKLVSTDGHRLSLVDEPLDSTLGLFTNGIIVPKKGVNEIKSLLSNDAENFEIACSDGRLYAKNQNILLSVTLIDASFPNYQQVIPEISGQGVFIPCNPFKNALRRVSILSDQETRSVIVEINQNVMTLFSDNPGLGDAKETISVEYSEQPVKIAFNANYIMDILKVMDDDSLRMEFRDSLSPVIFVGTDKDARFLSVVMPMRID